MTVRKFFTPNDFDDIIKVYFLWKKLNSLIKKLYTRGINLPEYITEGCVCYVNGYELTASFIIPNNIREYCIVDLKNKEVKKYDN